MLTLTDTTGRSWTIITAKAVAGFLWTVYIHHPEQPTGTLEELHPGGVANGWTELELFSGNELAMLTGIMATFGSTPGPGVFSTFDEGESVKVGPSQRIVRVVPANAPSTIPKPDPGADNFGYPLTFDVSDAPGPEPLPENMRCILPEPDHEVEVVQRIAASYFDRDTKTTMDECDRLYRFVAGYRKQAGKLAEDLGLTIQQADLLLDVAATLEDDEAKVRRGELVE